MKRISAAVLSLVLVLGTVGSVAAQDDAENIKIGMANLSLCCPYFIGMSEAVQQEASAYDNVEVLVTNADGDVEKLTSDIEDLIAKDVDGIVLSGAFIEAAPAALAAIQEAGIPVVMVDRMLKGGDYTSWVGPDNHAIGEQDGEFIVEQLGGTGKLGVIRGGPADNTIGSDRTDGMLSQVEPTEHRGHHLSRTSPAGARTAASPRPRPCWPRTRTSTPSSARTTRCAWAPRRSSRTRAWLTRSSWSASTARRPPSSRS